jgi:hypothetical protein
VIRRCDEGDFEAIYAIVNGAAGAYRGVIPADCWTEPYMPGEELRQEIGAGVVFWGYEEDGALADEIVVLDDGCIAARGTHDELVKSSLVYREIYEHGLLEQQFTDAVEARVDVPEVA